jgi:hypothetical protein
MIITNKIEIKVSYNNIKRLNDLNYNCKIGDSININVNDLSYGSGIKIKVKCDICGNEKEISYHKYNKNISKYNIYSCSSKCARFKNIQTNLEKYGVKNPLQNKEILDKVKKTVNEKYGVDNVFQDENIKKQIVKSNLERHGVEYPQQNKEILEKSNKTNIEKYGVDRPSKNIDIYNKTVKTNMERYGVENPLQNKDILEKVKKTLNKIYGVDNISQLQNTKNKIRDNSIKKQMEKLESINIISIDDKNENYTFKCDNGKEHNYEISKSLFYNRININTILCTICNSVQSVYRSGKEIELYEFIKKNYKSEILLNNRSILKSNELDIYLPELKLAFEFNGLYWHSEINKPNDYHLKKTELCELNNIQLIHVFEDD